MSENIPEVSAGELQEILSREEKLVLVNFWSPTCQPCRELRSQLGELPGLEPGLCRVVAVNVVTQASAATQHHVLVVPTLAFFKRGVEVRRIRAGVAPPRSGLVSPLSALGARGAEPPPAAMED